MLQCIVVTPERTLYDRPADFVAPDAVRRRDRHRPGPHAHDRPVGLRRNAHPPRRAHDRYYVEGGFVEVLDDVVSVLTQRAILAAEIDEAVAQEQLSSAQSRPATTPEALAIRDRTSEQSRAQLRVARRER